MIYCLVPADLASKLERLLTRSWQDDPTVAIVVERRGDDRRQAAERRALAHGGQPIALNRRRVVYPDGRRIAERRAILVPAVGPSLPRKAQPYADRLSFVEVLHTPAELVDGIEAARAIVRLQLGEERAARELYERYFDRVYAYLCVTLKHSSEAEERTGDVFVRMLEEAAREAPGPAEVVPWVFGIVHPVALAALPDAPMTASPPARSLGATGGISAEAASSLEWVTDDEIQLLVERTSVQQRQALMLRYMLGLSFVQIAAVLGVTPQAATELHGSAVAMLERSLAAVSRSPRVGGRHPMTRLAPQTPVLRQRRRALLAA